MKRFVENYLPIALMVGFAGSAGWTIFTLIFSQPAGPEDVLVTAMGMVIWLLAPFLLIVFLSGLMGGRKQGRHDQQFNILQYPQQRQRFGFLLMVAAITGLLIMVVSADPLLPITIGSSLIMAGGCLLVYSSL